MDFYENLILYRTPCKINNCHIIILKLKESHPIVCKNSISENKFETDASRGWPRQALRSKTKIANLF